MKETYIVIVPVTGNVEIVPFKKDGSYDQIREAVGGYLELAPIPYIKTKEKYGIDCFVDEEGLVKTPQRLVNRRLSHFARTILLGDAVFAAHDSNGETKGLTKEDADAIVALLTDKA